MSLLKGGDSLGYYLHVLSFEAEGLKGQEPFGWPVSEYWVASSGAVSLHLVLF